MFFSGSHGGVSTRGDRRPAWKVLYVTWTSPQWSILLWKQDELVSRAGLLVRDILLHLFRFLLSGLAVINHDGLAFEQFLVCAISHRDPAVQPNAGAIDQNDVFVQGNHFTISQNKHLSIFQHQHSISDYHSSHFLSLKRFDHSLHG